MNQISIQSESGKRALVYTISDTEEMDVFTFKMVDNNDIDGILPMVFSQKEDGIELSYLISDYQSLSEYSRNANISQVLLKIKGILRVVLKIQDYMLEDSVLLLEEDYIFIDHENKIQMAVIPDKSSVNTGLEAFLKYMMDFSQIDRVIDGKEYQDLIYYIGSDEFNISKFISRIESIELQMVANQNLTMERRHVSKPTVLSDKKRNQDSKGDVVYLRRPVQQNEKKEMPVKPTGRLIRLKLLNNRSFHAADMIELECKPGGTVIGRYDSSGQKCADYNFDSSVTFLSRKHVTISYADHQYYITDLDSKNGTLLNGNLLTGMRPYLLKVGDVIELSKKTKLAYQVEYLDE